ncbi:MAG: DUF4062 domain-containing protein [Pseudobdellovibrio sp.]|nr:DUF4062 domain-containing protein [Pseudobdellovibrio sp.]
MRKPTTLPYPKIIEYSKPTDIPFEFLKKTTAHHPVFLSSRFTGMEQLRKLVAEKFQEYGYPIMGWEVGETFGSSQKRQPREVYLDALKKSKVYCGILDKSYGPDIIADCSATEDEYNHAISWNHELCLLTSKAEPKEDKVTTLISKWKSKHTVSPFENEVNMITAVESFIKNHTLRIGMNWIMLGDLILPSGYKTTTSTLSVNFSTTNSSVIGYIKQFSKGDAVSFIDLGDGRREDLIVDEILVSKEASTLWKIEAQFLTQPSTPRMPWPQWSQLKDIRMDATGDMLVKNGDLMMVSGVERLPQVLKMNLNCNRGEWIFRPEMGSNLYNILNAYADSPELAELLIKFDVIETLTRPIDGKQGNKWPSLPCLDHVEIKSISNIKRISVDLNLLLFMQGLAEPIECSTTVKWNFEDQES